jgi:hypothetical protein
MAVPCAGRPLLLDTGVAVTRESDISFTQIAVDQARSTCILAVDLSFDHAVSGEILGCLSVTGRDRDCGMRYALRTSSSNQDDNQIASRLDDEGYPNARNIVVSQQQEEARWLSREMLV